MAKKQETKQESVSEPTISFSVSRNPDQISFTLSKLTIKDGKVISKEDIYTDVIGLILQRIQVELRKIHQI